MVATFLDQPITKSYVRLPGTGSDRRAGVSYCDLSRGSSLAATIYVPQSVGMPKYLTAKPSSSIAKNQSVAKPERLTTRPTSLVSVPAQSPASVPVPQSATGTVTSINNKRPRTQDDTDNANMSAKRICLERINQNVPIPSSNDIVRPEAVTVTMPSHSNCSNFTPTTNEPVRVAQNVNTIFSTENTEQEATKLKEENSRLKSENATLQKQLSLFKQLITNPKRLQSVLQTLSERAC